MKTFKEMIGTRLLSKGTHATFDWLVAHNDMGFRCGYVRVPPGHPWHGKHYDNIEASAHGGLTYAREFSDGWWVGFDCAHLDDAQDLDLPAEHIFQFGGHGVVRTQDYVEEQCKSLCEQAAQAV